MHGPIAWRLIRKVTLVEETITLPYQPGHGIFKGAPGRYVDRSLGFHTACCSGLSRGRIEFSRLEKRIGGSKPSSDSMPKPRSR